MSISSILGGETSSSTPLQNSPPIPPSAASPTSKSMQPPSPRRAPSAGARTEYGLYRRPHTPDRYSMGPASRPVDPPAYSTTSPSKNAANAGIPSDQSRHGLPPSAASPWNSVTQDSRLYSSANGPREKGMSSSSSMPQRPNSQPTGPATTSTEPDRKPLGESMGYRRQPYTYSPEERRRITSDHDQNRSTASEGTSRPPLQSNADLNRAVTVQPVSHSAFSPPRTGSTINSLNGVNQQPQPQSLFWRPQVHDDNRRQSAPPNRDEAPGLGRSTYGAQTAGGPPGTRTADGSPLPPRTIDYNTARPAGIYNAAPTSVPASVDRRREQLIGGAAQPGRASPYDQHPQRSFLLDATRRTGRASPLPQAVQGASSQPIGPAGNPNIKSEFGRMFSGLGGGISSVPSRNGTQTPSRQSPLPRGPGESFGSAGGDHADLEMARTGSQSGRKSKRTKDEDGLIDSDSLDGRATPTLGGARGAKRSKPNHAPGHHHHHHMHPHQYVDQSNSRSYSSSDVYTSHHHHHHKADEDAAATAATTTAAAAAASQTNSARLNPALAQSSASAQSLHHHHHHHASHPPHHHHHPPRPSTVPPPPQVIPKVIVNIQSVLDSVSENPRNHLGSQLYEAQPVAPPSTVPLEDRFGINTFPKPLPSFGRDRANCTFTIRVPRYYLRERQREMLCKRPYIWGSRIYRDDSDPLAAAVHSGWILGAWNKGEVDVKMLDPRIKGAAEPTDPEEPVTEIPAAPIEPPSNYDLQLTLLILPPLEKYHSTAEYGVRSRKAGGGYSGMSFMISSLRWVNEGIGSRGQERGAQAQSKRLSAAAALMALAMDRPADQGMSRKAAVGA